ncbi:hypothetical protein VNO78_07004 [Psophocarpus tetragonolobus]|uniref:RNase H type-1 domain-containing protein n=1 Tax=Psophocarpus tetragonolobus TaxID=3891 RepID=A0AAN9SUT9_PSOTE
MIVRVHPGGSSHKDMDSLLSLSNLESRSSQGVFVNAPSDLGDPTSCDVGNMIVNIPSPEDQKNGSLGLCGAGSGLYKVMMMSDLNVYGWLLNGGYTRGKRTQMEFGLYKRLGIVDFLRRSWSFFRVLTLTIFLSCCSVVSSNSKEESLCVGWCTHDDYKQVVSVAWALSRIPEDVKCQLHGTSWMLHDLVVDAVVWSRDVSGLYSAKSGYAWLLPRHGNGVIASPSSDSKDWLSWLYDCATLAILEAFGIDASNVVDVIRCGKWVLCILACGYQVSLHVDGSYFESLGSFGFGGLITLAGRDWLKGSMVLLIHDFVKEDWQVQIQHSLQEGNRCANYLTKKVVVSSEYLLLLDNPLDAMFVFVSL